MALSAHWKIGCDIILGMFFSERGATVYRSHYHVCKTSNAANAVVENVRNVISYASLFIHRGIFSPLGKTTISRGLHIGT